MAFNAATQWEFQTTGDNTNGGGFYNATPGTSVDLALANTPVTFTDLAIDAATNTKITSATRPFTAADTGNIINITSGTGFTVQRVQITGVDGSAVATCDKAVGTTGSTGGNGKMGGALAVPTDALLELLDDGMTAWVKSGTYTLTGDISISTAGSTANPIRIKGYNSTRDDSPTGSDRPHIVCGAYSFNLGNYWSSAYLSLITLASVGFAAAKYGTCVGCKSINNSTTAGRYALYDGGSYVTFYRCEGISTLGYGIALLSGPGRAIECYAHSGYGGIDIGNSGAVVLDSIIANCTTYGIYASGGGSGFAIRGCTIFGSSSPTGTGVHINATPLVCSITKNIISGWATGVNSVDVGSIPLVDENCFYNNTVNILNLTNGPNNITLDPEFVAAGNVGSDLCTNGTAWTGATGSTPPTGWAAKTAGTFTITAGGQAGDYLKIAHNGTNNNPEISFSIATEIGKSYRITYYAQKGTATNATAKVGTTSGGTEIGYTATHTDTDWNTQKSVSFEATSTTTYFSVGATTSTSGQYAMIDTVTIYEQGEDFTPGDNMKLDIDWTKMGL